MAQNTMPYRAFGIDFQSALPLPELREGHGGFGPPVAIRLSAAPAPEHAAEIDRGVVAGRGVFWMEVPGVARFRVSDGRDIAIEPLGNAEEGSIRAYLLGSAIGALLHQRGLFPLHASAVDIGGQAIAFIGTSGAGKSTMALHMVERGHALVADDICAIDTSGPEPLVWPGLCNLKLWRDALASTARAPDALEAVLPGLEKYRLPAARIADYRPYPVGALIGLETAPDVPRPELSGLSGASAVAKIVANTFRGQLVAPTGRSRAHFAQCTQVARMVRCQRLTRCWSLDGITASCILIERSVPIRN